MRVTTRLVIIMMFLNAGAELIRSSGIAADWGMNPGPGAGQKLSEAADAFQAIQVGSGLGETLFAAYLTVTKTIDAMFTAATAAPDMLINLGIPDIIVVFVFAPLPILIGRDIIYMLVGRSV